MAKRFDQIVAYQAPPHDCSYLPNHQATTVFVDLKLTENVEDYSVLSNYGFRRSGEYIYRPHCEDCKACVAVRVRVNDFTANKQQQRIIQKNSDLSVSRVKPSGMNEYYQLYERYICQRHADGDMYPPSPEQYVNFLVNAPHYCSFYEFRLDNQLLAVAVTDHLIDSLSAVYTFFEPEAHRRSLGQYAILWQIAQCQQLKLPYLYLGYWIKDCQKMNYKLQYRPIELFINNRWGYLT